jgi:hypothetical protein
MPARSVPTALFMPRRRLLAEASLGFGAVALAALESRAEPAGVPAALPRPHHPPRARQVIFCYMSGGVSHVDSFDPKPRLDADHGKPLPMKVERTMFNNNGLVMRSPFTFRPWGASGIPVSSMFPRIAEHVDDLAVIRSMTTPVSEHAQANFLMHTGFPFLGFPSAGAWASYGLGSENADLPSYVVLQSGNAAVPHGGVGLFSNGFLPGPHQASIVRADAAEAIRNIRAHDGAVPQRRRLDAVAALDRAFVGATGAPAAVEAAIHNAETAFRMQAAVPALVDIAGESAATRAAYGIDSPNAPTAAYGRQCLLARRLVERGVRFIELSCLTQNIGAGGAGNPWDQHGALEKGHAAMALQVDQPIAALIADLRDRGLLDETLVVWAGEFGRTPFSQGSDGRDHNPMAFSVWLAGGGVKGGTVHGVTDDFGYRVVEHPCTVYDMWATVLHLLGIDHEELTYRWGGRDYRLTDVHGRVIEPILA